MSGTSTSGGVAANESRPAVALSTRSTAAPSSSNTRRKSSPLAASSSTSSTRRPASTPSCSRGAGGATSGAASIGGLGSSTRKTAPWPSPSLFAVTVPPCASTRWRTMARASPRPPCARALAEAVEDEGEELRRDADAVVLHLDDETRVLRPCTQRDVAAFGGELDGVGEQVPHHQIGRAHV